MLSRATFRIDHPSSTNLTASILTRGSCGFLEYAIPILYRVVPSY